MMEPIAARPAITPMVREELERRVRTILTAVVRYYIDTGEPVGSRTLSKALDLGLSAATIRNVMADLTELGYLEQPYTSAGRIPTGKAYRFYVDVVRGRSEVPEEARQHIDETLAEPPSSLERMLTTTTKLLAWLTDFTGVVAAPRMTHTRLKLLDFIKLGSHQVYVVLITQTNMIYNKIIEVSDDLSQEFLNSVSRYLNEQFAQQTLAEIRQHILERLIEEKEQYDQLLAQAVRLSKKAFDISEGTELYVEGQFNIIKDFQDLAKVQRLIKALEEKITVLDLLDQALDTDGVQVLIGGENPVTDLQECSVITATYGDGDQPLGSIGIIGPTRMDYMRIIPIIDYTARRLSKTLARA